MRYVLFVCTHNAGRSQMAQALFERHAPDDVRAESAGAEPRKQGVWPNVIEAMRELGVDLSQKRPQKLTVEMQLHADWAVTLACGAECPYVPTTVEDWDVPDPAGKSLEETREIRDAIELRVRNLIATRLDEIRSDRTAHQLRLIKLVRLLSDDSGDDHTPAEIRAAADAALLEFVDAPVRSFVMAVAMKNARELLRKGAPMRVA